MSKECKNRFICQRCNQSQPSVLHIEQQVKREKQVGKQNDAIGNACVVYQGPNQTNQDSIKAWLKHEEPNSTKGRTRQQQEVLNQIPSSSPSEYSLTSKPFSQRKTIILIDNSNAGRRLSNLVIHLNNTY